MSDGEHGRHEPGVQRRPGVRRTTGVGLALLAASAVLGVVVVQQAVAPDRTGTSGPAVPATTPAATATGPVVLRGRWTGTATVLRRPGGPLLLCGGGVATSLPPAGCGGVEVRGLDDPASLPGVRVQNGVLWTDEPVRMVGTWDGRVLTLTERPTGPEQPETVEPGPPLQPACDEPGGGWPFDRFSEDGRRRAVQYVYAQPDYGSVWVSGDQRITSVTFTGDLARHERALRDLYEGPLCVASAPRSHAELDRLFTGVQQEMETRGLLVFGASLGRDSVEVQLAALTPEQEIALRQEYGGLLVPTSFLRPLPA